MNPDRNERTKGKLIRRREIQSERHRGELANRHSEMAGSKHDNLIGDIHPIAETSGDFKRLYGCNFAEIARNHTLVDRGNVRRREWLKRGSMSFFYSQ